MQQKLTIHIPEPNFRRGWEMQPGHVIQEENGYIALGKAFH